MADQQHGAVVIVQQLLQQIQRLDIQVVGRFVQHQDVAFPRHQLGQKQPRLFPARERPHRRPRLPFVEQEFLQIADHVFRLAAHQDLVRLARHPHFLVADKVFPKALIRIQRRAALIEDRRHQVGPLADLAAVRRDLAHQQLDQRGLAHAIGPDKGHPVTAHHPQVQVAHDHLVAKGLAQAFGLDHLAARFRPRGQLHRRRALPLDLRRAVGPQVLQGAHTALVALAAGRNALDRPSRLGLDLAIQLVAGQVFLIPDLVAPGLEGAKALFLPPHLAPVDPKRALGQRPQKGPVVGNQHIGGAGLRQLGLQPLDRFDIQVVGRLVQQHQIGRFGHQLGQRRAPPFPARGGLDRPRRIELQPFRGHLDPVGLRRIQARGREIPKRGKARHVGLLLHIADAGARRDDPRAAVGLDQTGHDLHQGGFARPVAPDKRHAVAGLNHQRQIGKHGISAEGQRDVGKL